MVNRLYKIAYCLILFAIIAGQLIWLPAPLFNDTSLEWIAIINILYYSLLLIPLLFLCVTLLSLKQYIHHEKFTKRYVLLASLIMLLALYLCESIIKMDMLQAVIGLVLMAVVVYVYLVLIQTKVKGEPFKKQYISLVVYVAILTILICPISYNVTYPFFTFNLDRYAKIVSVDGDGYQLDKSKGEIEGVLVAERQAFIVDMLYSKWLKQVDLTKRTKTELPITEQYTKVVSQKLNSNRIAEAYAWQAKSGQTVIKPVGVRVVSVISQSAAEGKLEAGDVIVAIESNSISSLTDLSSAMSEVTAGQTITIKVLTETGQQREIELTVKGAEDNPNKAFLGIYIEQAVELQDPLAVEYKHYIAHFGGPSHGAMLTINFLNQLNKGQLVGAMHIAGTGTIEIDGSIGMVGGVKQKAYAVSRTNAEVFFVPEAAYEQAKEGAPQLNIVPIKHIDDIISWLAQNQKA